jgi:hypothetical protein
MDNDNQARTEESVQGLAHNLIDASWFGDSEARRNGDINALANSMPQDAAGASARENEPPPVLERITLADGSVVTRQRTTG